MKISPHTLIKFLFALFIRLTLVFGIIGVFTYLLYLLLDFLLN